MNNNYYFDDKYITQIWVDYFELSDTTEKDVIREEIINASIPIIKYLINMLGLLKYDNDEEEWLHIGLLKLINDFDKFDVKRDSEVHPIFASAFVYVTTIVKNRLLTELYRTRRKNFYIDSLEEKQTDVDIEEESTCDETFLTDNLEDTLTREFTALGDFKIKISVLKNTEVGIYILEYLDLMSFLEGKISFEESKELCKMRSLLKFLHSKGFSTTKIKNYIKTLRKQNGYERIRRRNKHCSND